MIAHILLIQNNLSSANVEEIKKAAETQSFGFCQYSLLYNSKQDIHNIGKIIKEKQGRVIIIGHDIGATYARYFNVVWDVPSIVINPVHKVSEETLYLLEKIEEFRAIEDKPSTCILFESFEEKDKISKVQLYEKSEYIVFTVLDYFTVSNCLVKLRERIVHVS